MNENPFISVLICTYKRKELLQRAILSVLRQNYENLQIVISDDKSNDGTKELCEELCQKHKEIFYSQNCKYKKGPNGNKNNALDEAKGEFILFLDDDDELLPNALNILAAKLKEGFSQVLANCLIKRGELLTNELSGRGFDRDQEVSKKDFLLGKMNGEFIGIFEKALLEGERFDEENWGLESTLWIKLYAKKSFYLHQPLRIYTQNEKSVTKGANANANRVYRGYEQMAKLVEAEMKKSQDSDYKGICASYYKMAAYYAKMAKEYKKMYQFLFKSLAIKPNFAAFALLCVSFVPKKILEILTKIRVILCKN